MAERDNEAIPQIKITRKRKRLYEPLPEGTPETKALVPISNSSPEVVNNHRAREVRAHEIIMDHVMWSAGTALIPVPFLDTVAVTAIELKMLRKLCKHYGMEFSKHRGKSLIAALIGGFHAGMLTGSFFKAIPVFGLAGVIVPMAVISGAITYAVGKVFVQHFEAGGTLLDFEPAKMRQFFAEQYRKGQLENVERDSDLVLRR